MTSDRLTTQEFWRDTFWKVSTDELPDVVFDPQGLEFRHVHLLLKRFLPPPPARCLEIGCAPGRYLHYFWKEFGYEPVGLEYVAEAAELSRAALREAGVPATVITGDLFEYSVPPLERYDVVFSYGVVEHFHDVATAVERHANLVAPGGFLTIFVPNHVGLHGWILRATQPEIYRIHNQMNWETLRQAVAALPEFQILAGGYFGHFNLAPSGLLPWWRQKVPYRVYRVGELAHNFALRHNRWLPESALLSPMICVVARRQPEAGDT